MPCIPDRDDPLMLRGRLTVFRRRCGTPNCRCVDGDRHESPALTYTEAGRTKTLTLRPGEVSEVEAALARYDAVRAELESSADAGIAALRARRGRKGGRS